MWWIFVVGLLTLLMGGCGARPTPTSGVDGLVLRGPVQPVCQAEESCADVPFAAAFSAEREGLVWARFRSAANGHFQVRLEPGMYRLRPGPDAPLLAPETQTQAFAVPAGPPVSLTFHFDTGIR